MQSQPQTHIPLRFPTYSPHSAAKPDDITNNVFDNRDDAVLVKSYSQLNRPRKPLSSSFSNPPTTNSTANTDIGVTSSRQRNRQRIRRRLEVQQGDFERTRSSTAATAADVFNSASIPIDHPLFPIDLDVDLAHSPERDDAQLENFKDRRTSSFHQLSKNRKSLDKVRPTISSPNVKRMSTSNFSSSPRSNVRVQSHHSTANAFSRRNFTYAYPLDRRLNGDMGPSVEVRVTRSSLRNAVNNGLKRHPFLSRLFRQNTYATVEARSDDRYDSIFYAPFAEFEQQLREEEEMQNELEDDQMSSRRNRRRDVYENPPMETQFIPCDPYSEDVPHLCHAADDFEISFVGMSVPPADTVATDRNELLLYSLRSHMFPDDESDGSDKEDVGRDESDTERKHAAQEVGVGLGRASRTGDTRRTSFGQLSITDAIRNANLQKQQVAGKERDGQGTLETVNPNRSLDESQIGDTTDDDDLFDTRTGQAGEEVEHEGMNMDTSLNLTSSTSRAVEFRSRSLSGSGNANPDPGSSVSPDVRRPRRNNRKNISNNTNNDKRTNDANRNNKNRQRNRNDSDTRPGSDGNRNGVNNQNPLRKTPDNPTGSANIPPSVKDPNGINLLPTDFPLIHYDPVIDGRNQGTIPNAFISVPASKSLFRQHRSDCHWVGAVPLRFTIMEIDKLSSEQAKIIGQIDSVRGFASQVGVAVPYADIVTSAVSVLNSLGRRALKKYTRPDHIISLDFEFRLYKELTTPTPSKGPGAARRKRSIFPYLRYGYYFFLKDPVDAKLYAQTDVSSLNVQLLLKHANFTEQMERKGMKKYFPLSGVAYAVIKVTPGLSKQPKEKTRARAMENRARLEHILHVNNAIQMLTDLKT